MNAHVLDYTRLRSLTMTMHLLGPAYNNIGNSHKKPTVKQQKAKVEHESYLRKIGCHPDQLASRVKPTGKFTRTVKPEKTDLECSNGFGVGGFKKSVFDSEWQRTYADDPVMADRESVALKAAQAKKANLMPLYHKGPVQYAGNLKMTELGKRR